MTSACLTLVPATPRLQARIVRLCDMLQRVRMLLSDCEDDPFDYDDALIKTIITNGRRDEFPPHVIKLQTRRTKDPSVRSLSMITIGTNMGSAGFRASEIDTPIIGCSPIDLVRNVADILRPLPDRAFRILDEGFGGPGHWQPVHPLLELMNTAYAHHDEYRTVMGVRPGIQSISALRIPHPANDAWSIRLVPGHRGMMAHTTIDVPVGKAKLRPETVRRIGNFLILDGYAASNEAVLTTKEQVSGRIAEAAPIEQMRHLALMASFADSISPPPPTPIRRS